MMDFHQLWQDFHFLRPYYLLALPLGLAFYYTLRQMHSGQSNWTSVIDAKLLTHLIDKPESTQKKSWHITGLFMAWIIACLAMAGPAWERVPQMAEKKQDALIIILDLSLSMYAEDQKPSRLINAKRKISDILAARKDGLTSLIVYSGDAHIVTPLTNDTETIATMIPVLEPGIMPKIGSNLASALMKAEDILLTSGNKKADVFLLTDEIASSQINLLANLPQKNLHLSVLTFGTTTGAPIPVNTGFLKTPSGETVIARLNHDEIHQFASDNHLLVIDSVFNDSDIQQLLGNLSASEETQATERTFDVWQDAGHWLTLLLIPFLLLNFRRGWFLLVFLAILPDNSYALEWNDLWQTKNQQAAAAFKQGDIKTAADTFEHPQWKSSSHYKNGDYEAALKGFESDTTATGLYNKGNALAKTGQLDEAIKAYSEALKKQPDFTDAALNKTLVEKVRKEQKKQEQEQEQEQEQKNPEEQNKDDQQPSSEQKDSQQQPSGDDSSGKEDSADTQGNDPQNNSPQNNPSDTGKNNQPQSADDKPSQHNIEENSEKDNAKSSAEQKETNEPSEKQETQTDNASAELTPMEKEQQQAMQQWLRKIPDDPGQLLRNKFRYQYESNRNNNEHLDKDSEQLW